jgi:hypothetical protein
MESICDYHDTLPLPNEVQHEYRESAGDNLTALAWLEERGIGSAPEHRLSQNATKEIASPAKLPKLRSHCSDLSSLVSHSLSLLRNNGFDLSSSGSCSERELRSGGLHVALIQYGMVWNPETGRYRFLIYDPGHVGPKYPPELAIPIIENGVFVDLLCISDEMSFARVTCRAPWLGRENLTQPVVRLHPHPLDWVEAGCTGVCHIEPVSRKALKELRSAKTIECNDIHAALEAWSWGFADDDGELARFVIDDTAESVSSYIDDEVQWRVLSRFRQAGLPVGADPMFADPEHEGLVEKMQSEYVYAAGTSGSESQT